ncbi:hypothetical protein [Mycoplasma sp. Z1473D]
MKKYVLMNLGAAILPIVCLTTTNCARVDEKNIDKENKPKAKFFQIDRAIIPNELASYIKQDNVNKKISDKDYYKLILKAYANIYFLNNKEIDKSVEETISSISSNVLNKKEKDELSYAINNLESLNEIVDNDFEPFTMQNIAQYHGFETTLAKSKITKAEHLFLLMCKRFNGLIKAPDNRSLALRQSPDTFIIHDKIWDLVQMILWATSNSDCLIVTKGMNPVTFVPTVKNDLYWLNEYIQPSSPLMYDIYFEKVNDNPYAIMNKQMIEQIIDLLFNDKKFITSPALPNDYDAIFSSNENAIKYIDFKKEILSKIKDDNKILDIIFYY